MRLHTRLDTLARRYPPRPTTVTVASARAALVAAIVAVQARCGPPLPDAPPLTPEAHAAGVRELRAMLEARARGGTWHD